MRSPSRPCSGRTLRVRVVPLRPADRAEQHGVGAARSARASRRAAAVPVASMARRRSAPRAKSKLVAPARRRPRRSTRTRLRATTSGPMPSPGRTVIFACMASPRHLAHGPRAPRLERRDRGSCASRKPSSSTPFSRQCRANGSIGNVTRPPGSVERLGSPDRRSPRCRAGLARSLEPRVRRGVDDDGQQPVLQRVVAEDVGELGADHGAEAVVEQRPRRVLARRAAAEVVARRPAPRRPATSGRFSTKSGSRRAVARRSASRRTACSPSPALLGRLEEARRDDLVGVDVVDRAGRHASR